MATRAKTICRQAGCSSLVDVPGYCARHADQSVGWQRSHGGQGSTQRGYGYRWQKLRERVMQRDQGLCQCGDCLGGEKRVRIAHHVDHIIPKSQGGTDDLNNLQAINRECHKQKTARENR